MQSDLIRTTGLALYGPRWQSELAGALTVNRKTIQRWLDGTTPLPDHIPDELTRLIRERIALLRSLK